MWSAASRDPARSNRPSSTRGSQGHGSRENLRGTAEAPGQSAHRYGGKRRNNRSITFAFHSRGMAFGMGKTIEHAVYVLLNKGLPAPPPSTLDGALLRSTL